MPSSLKYSHGATVLPVSNIQETLSYYENHLQFNTTFRWGEPVSYAVGKLGEDISIHFTEAEQSPSYTTALYIFVYDVDEFYLHLKDSGVNITNDIADREYGMRDFDIVDLNGFRLTFATGIDRLK